MASRPAVRRVLLHSDGLSPNGASHDLPFLHWRGLFSKSDDTLSPSEIRSKLLSRGWEPQWTFPMFKEAHYHSTTHELLTVIQGSATILLGGADELAGKLSTAERSDPASSPSWETVPLGVGDVLLLPAGYSHRALSDRDGFSMIGSYPRNGRKWDMCYPTEKSECQAKMEGMKKWITSSSRKGLGEAQSPESEGQGHGSDDLTREWEL